MDEHQLIVTLYGRNQKLDDEIENRVTQVLNSNKEFSLTKQHTRME